MSFCFKQNPYHKNHNVLEKVIYCLFIFFFREIVLRIFFVVKGGKQELNDAANTIDDCYNAIVKEFGEPPPEKPPKKPKPINLLDDFDDTASVATNATDTKSVIGNSRVVLSTYKSFMKCQMKPYCVSKRQV